MKREILAVVFVAALLTGACGSNPLGSVTPSTVPSAAQQAQGSGVAAGGRFQTQGVVDGVTYVGPIRLPISVHGTTVQLSWLGNDDASRGYELEFQRYDVSNVWVPALHDVVTKPEAKEFLTSEGTYRVRVRGLFADDFAGGFTDYVVFSTDDHNTPVPPAVVIIPSEPEDPPCGELCVPPPPDNPGGGNNGDGNNGNGNGNGGGNGTGNEGNGNGPGDNNSGGNDNQPPPFVDVALCHAEYHPAKAAHGHNPAEPAYYSYQDKTAHSQAELDQHIGLHDHDYLGACQQ